MGRIRSIKPEFPQSESVGRLSRDARLLFIQIWTICDDYGRCRAAARLLAGQLYPYDTDAVAVIPKWLAELAKERVVEVYEVDGNSYLQVVNWSKHQRVDNAGKPMVPAPSPRTAAILGEPPRVSEDRGDLRLDLGGDQDQERDLGVRSGSGSQGEREGESARVREEPKPAEPEPASSKPKLDPNRKMTRDEVRLNAYLAEKRIMDFAVPARLDLVQSASAAGVTVDTCRAFMASLKDRGKDGEDAKGLLVTQLRSPEAFAIWHKAESYQPKETNA